MKTLVPVLYSLLLSLSLLGCTSPGKTSSAPSAEPDLSKLTQVIEEAGVNPADRITT